MKDLPQLIRVLTDPLSEKDPHLNEADEVIENVGAHVKKQWEEIQSPIKKISAPAIKRSQEIQNLKELYQR